MTKLTRRSVMSGSAAVIASGAAAVVPVAMASAIDPNKRVLDLQAALKDAMGRVTPITPAEYLAEMEANGWLPVTRIGRNGEPRGVFEYTVEYPTADAMSFLHYINCRVHRSGRDFYECAAWHLFEQGRGVPYTEFDQPGWRPPQCNYDGAS